MSACLWLSALAWISDFTPSPTRHRREIGSPVMDLNAVSGQHARSDFWEAQPNVRTLFVTLAMAANCPLALAM